MICNYSHFISHNMLWHVDVDFVRLIGLKVTILIEKILVIEKSQNCVFVEHANFNQKLYELHKQFFSVLVRFETPPVTLALCFQIKIKILLTPKFISLTVEQLRNVTGLSNLQ